MEACCFVLPTFLTEATLMSRFVYASVARLAVLKFVNYMNASADVLALASIEVPINGIPDGGCIVVK